MRDSGRLSAAIEILEDFDCRRVPLKIALADWARGARYAGAKDRAWISGLCLDVLRRKNSLSSVMGETSPRGLALGAMRTMWGASVETLAELCAEEPHGPGALRDEERSALAGVSGDGENDRIESFSSPCSMEGIGLEQTSGDKTGAPPHILGDFPEWLTPHMRRAFGDGAVAEGAALAARADIDLRLNTLKAPPEKSLAALAKVKGASVPILTTAARIAAPPASEKAAAITVIPAFNKGWVEVQDLGSQIAAAAAGDIKGEQVTDFCAGGGGKTLALAALMENTGQLYAYDIDPRRLKPIYARTKRAGVRNLQILDPSASDELAKLESKMDVVFVDAPCTGAGTWRRRPDTKWRLTEKQLAQRIAEQDAVLGEAAKLVKPGGRMVFATCSFLMEECEDRLAAFLGARTDFRQTPALREIAAAGVLTDTGEKALARCTTPDGAVRMTPARLRADGFFVATLKRDG